jgi:hypothetical protein
MSVQMQSNRQYQNRSKATIKYSDFDYTKLIINQVEDNKLNPAQKLTIPKIKQDQYGDSLVQIQTHPIYFFTYGIPKEGTYYKDDASRSFVKIPEDINDPKSVDFFNRMEQVDKFMVSPEGKKKVFGSEKIANNYVYQPIVRVPENKEEEEEDEDDNNKQKAKKQNNVKNLDIPRPRYMKVKIDLDWETKAIKTKILNKDEDGKRVPVQGVSTLDDVIKYIRYKSTSTFVIMMNKIYASKNKLGDSKKYGIGFKLVQSLSEPPNENNYSNDEDAFIDDEDIGFSQQLSSVKIIEQVEHNDMSSSVVKVNLQNALDATGNENEDEDENDEEDDEEDDENDEEEEDTVIPPKKSTEVKTANPPKRR